MSAFASTSTYSFATKDAAAKEREDRLLAAKKKLKLYRARTSQRLGSTSSAVTDASASPIRATRRQSGLTSSISSQADFAAKHAHRRSQSKSGLLAAMGGDAFVGSGASAGGPGHARRMSKGNRASRNSISLKKGHGHNRSRASISMSFSGPAPQLAPPSSEPERSITPTPRHPSNLGAPSSWQQQQYGGASFPSHSPDLARPSSIIRSTSPLPPAPSPGPHPPKHARHGSRHTRRSSVSNFRESLDLVGAGTADPAHTLLHPAVSSFAPTGSDGTGSPATASSPRPHASTSTAPSSSSAAAAASHAWPTSNNPQQVLAALKERGRREVDDPSLSPEQTRQSALEALEGRVSAPSEMISLGNEEPGELLVAPRSPGYTVAAGGAAAPLGAGFVSSPLPPNGGFNASPMIGLGVSGHPASATGGAAGGPMSAAGKRSSWGPLGGVAGVGAQGVMELGGIAEEDEEEEEEYVRRTGRSPVSSPKRGSPSPRKGRPASLFVEPRRGIDAVVAAASNSTPTRSSTISPATSPTTTTRRSSIRPLSLSLSSNASSSGTPSTVAGPFGRRESLAAPSSPEDVRQPSSPGEKRHISMFHSAAAMGLDPAASAAATQSAVVGAAPIAQRGGLRSLSIGGAHSPSALAEKRFPGRPASLSATGAVGYNNLASASLSASAPPSSTPRKVSPAPSQQQKRSSISYLTSSSTPTSASASTPTGSSSPEHQKRAWLSSFSSSVGGGPHHQHKDSSPAVSTSHYSSFPLGAVGGFGDLEIDGETSSAQPSPSRLSFGLTGSGHTTGRTSPSHRSAASASTASAAAAAAAAAEEISSLRSQVSSLEARNSQLASTHALEIAEFEKKASDEALEMRSRISALEASVEDERVARRFEVEGLQREAAMAREAIGDLTEERDAVREDVDGWRSRCASLEAQVKKEREDEALAQAQAKLIGEMRDQIYTLVAALERERGEHAETRREVERMLEERVREAAAEAKGLGNGAANGRPDDLALIMEEDDDDVDDVTPEEDEEDDRLQQQLQPAAGRHHPYKTPSGGSMLSTGSSTFSRSFSGNTTEDTSVMMSDLDDSFSTKLSSPPSGHSSFSAVVGGAFPPPASANPNRNSVRDADAVAAALGQLDTLAEEDEEDEEALIGGGATPAAQYQPQQQQQQHHHYVEEPARFSSESTASTSSDVMPRTPERSQADHNRSHSFVRHWSFPRGSVTSARPSMEDDDQSFFGYNKHDSLPPLPIGDHVLPPFLTSTLDVDETAFSFFPPQPVEGTVEVAGHVRRPSSPRPLDRMSNPHLRRVSGQYGKAPPPSPSALVSAALQHQQAALPHHQAHASAASSTSSGASPSKSTSRYSFGALIGSIGGWSPSSSASLPGSTAPPPPVAASKLAFASGPLVEADEDEESTGGVEEDVFITTHSGPPHPTAAPPPRTQPQPQQQQPSRPHGTPVQLQHQNQHQNRLRYIAKHEVPTPKAGRLAQLNFANSVCCLDMPVFVV
ncbi:hypothetical protein JCM6882_002852 [Rhodosporidiobolus microsporus]